jgi:hypothetical protein
MHDMLAMQIVERHRDLRANLGDLRIGQGEFGQPRQQCRARDGFHHDVGLRGEIAGGDELRHMCAGKPRQDHLLHFETDNGRRIRAFADQRHFHQQRHGGAGARDAPQRCHTADMRAFIESVAVNDRSRFVQRLDHSPPLEQPVGQPYRQAFFADRCGGLFDVVSRAAIREFALVGIQHRI